MNGYMSTSESSETASVFATNVLFEIHIDLSIDNIIFANIAEYSQFPEEQEVLFDLGCIFKIFDVVYDDSNQPSRVKMIAVDEGEKLASEFIKTIKEKKKTSGYLDGLLKDFIHKIGYEKGIRLYEHFLRLSTNDVNRVIKNCSVFLRLYEKSCDISNVIILNGCFFTQRAEYNSAIDYCIQALSLLEKNSSNDAISIEIAMIHNTIGWSFYEKEDYDTALHWCQKAREIFRKCPFIEDSKYVKVLRSEGNLKKSPPRNEVEYAEILTNIGCIYCKKEILDMANFYCKKSMNMLGKHDHEIIFGTDSQTEASKKEIDNHQETIAANYEVFADIYYKEGNYARALEYYHKAENIFETITPRIPICLQRSPFIFDQNRKRLQNSIRLTEQKVGQ